MKQIKQLVTSLHINATYCGYKYLCYALYLCLQNEDYLQKVWKLLYAEIAAHYDEKRVNVERALRTVVDACWRRGGKKRLQDISGYDLSRQPAVGEFICILVYYLNNED